ncbi:MAG: radical SAM protein [Actinomycetota bacterium]|nr:radical SAM protein [Actinomycetota bacterium]
MSEPVSAFPQKIQVQTQNRCNFACSMCPYPALAPEQDQVQMESELFCRLVDEVAAANAQVQLCLMLQNEPLLDRRFVDFLDYAHGATDAIVSVSTVTNGSTLTPQLLDRLMRYERFKLTISVNATEAQRYKAVHGRGVWERISGLLTGWHGQRDRVRVSFVVDADSVEEGTAFHRFWRAQGYATRFVPMNSRVDTLPGDRGLSLVEADFGFCHYPVDTLTVLADGSVILCCNDWRHEPSFGNLHDTTVAELWNHPELSRLRAAAIDGRLRQASAMCRQCDYPMRSARRVRLEALIKGSPDPRRDGAGRLGHASTVVLEPDGKALPVWVWDIVPEAATVAGLLTALPDHLPADVSFEMRIGHEGLFDFGGLGSVWCPGRMALLDGAQRVAEAVPAIITLDRRAPAFRFFSWYTEDWSLPESAQPLPLSRGGEASQHAR